MPPNPFLLAADDAPTLRNILRQDSSIASKQDDHGYSLLHAAASYGHASLLRALVREFGVDVNLKDEDGETCLFVVESVDVARCLVEELHIDTSVLNDDGMTATQKIEDEAEYLEVASYLTQRCGGGRAASLASGDPSAPITGQTYPPPLPANVTIDVNTTSSHILDDPTDELDPEFRKRIEDLAAKDNFGSEEQQSELRALVTDAIREVTAEESSSRIRMQ